MSQIIGDIKESLSKVHEELLHIEFRLAKQGQYMNKLSLESVDLLNYLIEEYKLTRASFELLREEVAALNESIESSCNNNRN